MSARKIQPEMFAYIDARLASNGLAQDAIKNRNARQLLIEAAGCCVGIREQGGNNEGPLVELIQRTIGGASGEAWCMSFVQTCLGYVEQKLKLVSQVVATEHCLTCWSGATKDQRVQYLPLPGAIVIWRHGSSQSGHTGILREFDAPKARMRVIEGNTESGLTPGGKVERDGGGVYHTMRSTAGSGEMKVVGYIKPF